MVEGLVDNHEQDLAPGAHDFPLSNSQLIAAEIFRLTDLVHGLVAPARSNTPISPSRVVAVYKECLDLYERLFGIFDSEGSRTPFVLFIQYVGRFTR